MDFDPEEAQKEIERLARRDKEVVEALAFDPAGDWCDGRPFGRCFAERGADVERA